VDTHGSEGEEADLASTREDAARADLFFHMKRRSRNTSVSTREEEAGTTSTEEEKHRHC